MNAVDTTNGYVLDKAQIDTIPLPTGSFTGLAILSAGVNAELPGVAAGGTYVSEGQGNSLEVICAPREFDPTFGFSPQPQLRRQPSWTAAKVPPAAPAAAGA